MPASVSTATTSPVTIAHPTLPTKIRISADGLLEGSNAASRYQK